MLWTPTGEPLALHRKANLFETDLPWAAPGEAGFCAHDLPAPLGRTTLAICNDLNVHGGAMWASLEDGPYELAEFCVRAQTRLLVLLNAWLSPEDGGEEEGEEEGAGKEDVSGRLEPNWAVLNYWATRLRPTWAQSQVQSNLGDSETTPDSGDLVVVVCNRFGREGGAEFGCLVELS